MNDFAFLLFTTQKYSSFNPPYFPKRTLKFFLNSIPACSDIIESKQGFDFDSMTASIERRDMDMDFMKI